MYGNLLKPITVCRKYKERSKKYKIYFNKFYCGTKVIRALA